MKKYILSAFAALTSQLLGATVSVSPGGAGVDFKYDNGTIITDVSPHHIRIGYFSNYSQTGTNAAPVAPEAFRTLLADPTRTIFDTIATHFVPIGEGRANLGIQKDWSITALTGALAGKFSVNTSLNDASLVFSADPANSVSSGGLPRGTRLFLLAYNTEDPSQATELGIFSGSSSTAGQWYVPTTAATSVALNLGLVDSVAATGLEVFRGRIGSLVLAPIVPEPSTGLLALIAGCGLMARRRR